MTMIADRPLSGLGILVTRPIHQAAHLAEQIAAEGGEPILFPTLEILDAADMRPALELIARLDHFDYAIFISPNAVAKGMGLIGDRQLPAHLGIAAVGKGSATALKRSGVQQVIAPLRQFDSEGLLELAQFQDLRAKRVAIFRGQGGRELLGETLAARGAQVEYAECYRRARPDLDPAPLLQRWARGEVNAVTVTSGESLHNLRAMLGDAGRHWLEETPLFAPHERIAEVARSIGLRQVNATGAGDEGLMTGLIAWQNRAKR